MASVGAARLRWSFFNSQSPGREIIAGEHCVFKLEVLDEDDGLPQEDADVTSVTIKIWDKATDALIHAHTATVLPAALGTNYIGLNETDNAIVGSPAVGAGEVHVIRATVVYVAGVTGVDTVISEQEFTVREIGTPA